MKGARVAALAVLALLAGRARADYKDTYRKALEAVDRKRWGEVAALMREAIAQNPKEGEKVKLYGLRFETYLPHLHLGLALSQTGDCAGALRALQTSDEQGAVKSTPFYAQLVEAQKVCAPKVAQAPATTAPAPPTTQAAPAPPPSTAPATPLPTLAAAVAPPPASSAPFRSSPSPPPPTLAARSSPLPPELVRAAEAYFAGRYVEAIEKLERLSGLPGSAGAHALLFRAAGRYALFRAGGEKDGALMQRVAADVAACRKLSPGLVPDAEAFPPTFAELFRLRR